MIYPREVQQPGDVADHYDDLDHWYLTIWGEHVHHGYWRTGDESTKTAVKQLVEFLARRTRIESGTAVCDVGCGYGATARFLAKDYDAQVEAYTLSKAQYDYACTHSDGAENPRYHHCDWFKNTVPDASKDVAISIESSEHMEDKEAFFREMHRVLKPGGRVGVCAWLAKDNPKAWEENHLLEPICREGRLPSMGDESDYRTMMEDAGFTSIEFTELTQHVKRTWPIILGRIFKRLTWDREAWKQVLRGPNREFGRTAIRICIAYYTCSMRYGLFTGEKAG